MGGGNRFTDRLACIAADPPAIGLIRRSRGQCQVGNGRDARQRFAPKAQASDTLEILEAGDLAGGMADKRERQIIAMDAAPIIADSNQTGTTLFHLDSNASCTGVQAVFKQFLHDRRRSLDHFACRDLADQLRRQPPNTRVQTENSGITGNPVGSSPSTGATETPGYLMIFCKASKTCRAPAERSG